MDLFDLDLDGDSMLNSIEIEKISNDYNISIMSLDDIPQKPSSSDSTPDRLNQGSLLVDIESPITTTSKRKSTDNFTDFQMNNAKRQSIEPIIIDNDYFHSQFFRQIDEESAAATVTATKIFNKNDHTKETANLSQMFFSQFDTGWSQQVKALKLTQLFGDDNDNDNDFTSDTTKQQSSQRFLNDIQKSDEITAASQRISLNSQNVQQLNVAMSTCTIYKSKNASEYMELQRSMQEINEDNVNDDNFLDVELSQAYKSTQYRREILSEINQCERSVADISNLPPLDENVSSQTALPQVDDINWTEQFVTSPIRKPMKAAAASVIIQSTQRQAAPSHDTELANIENMNWTEKFDVSPMRNSAATVKPLEMTPTTIIRERLKANKIRLGMLESPPRTSTSSTSKSFTNLGPFFGLPLQVQRLIKDFKGIDHLYGTTIFFHLFIYIIFPYLLLVFHFYRLAKGMLNTSSN